MAGLSNPLANRAVQAFGLIFAVNFCLLLVFDRSWVRQDGGGGGSDLLRQPCPDCGRPRPVAYVSMEAATRRENLTLSEELSLSMGTMTTTTTEGAAVSSPEKQMELFRRLMKERREVVREGCQEMATHKGSPYAGKTYNYQNVVVMKSRDIVWCPVFKASSSTWLTYLLDIYDGFTSVRAG